MNLSDIQPPKGLRLSDLSPAPSVAPEGYSEPSMGEALWSGIKDIASDLQGTAASAARGLAPAATGAALGAAMGAPLAGVGAIPGAAAGATAAAGAQLGTALWNSLLGERTGARVTTPQEATDIGLDVAGIRRPESEWERGVQAVAGGAAGTVGPARFAGDVAAKFATSSPVVSRVAGQMAYRPGQQALSGALGGAGGQIAAEAEGGPLAQYAASMLAGFLPYAPKAAVAMGGGNPRPAALEAVQAGYVLPPTSITEKPGMVSSLLAGWGGKIKTAQGAAERNQTVTNELAAQALGQPRSTELTPALFENIRQQAGQAYQAVASVAPVLNADAQFAADITKLGSRNSQAQLLFPKITRNPGIAELVDDLTANPQIPTGTAVEIVKELRFNANANLKAREDPSKLALGLAQRQAADAMDALMERTAIASGAPDVVQNYRDARMLIAKSYDVESATNEATGDVNARRLASLKAHGRPLTGELDTIANVALAFPQASRPPAGFGYTERHSILDLAGAAASAAHGHMGLAATILGRPAGRSAVLSRPIQETIVGMRHPTLPLPLITAPGASAVVQPPGVGYPTDRSRTSVGGP